MRAGLDGQPLCTINDLSRYVCILLLRAKGSTESMKNTERGYRALWCSVPSPVYDELD